MNRQVCGHERFFGNRINFFLEVVILEDDRKVNPIRFGGKHSNLRFSPFELNVFYNDHQVEMLFDFFSASLTVEQNDLNTNCLLASFFFIHAE